MILPLDFKGLLKNYIKELLGELYIDKKGN
jgi:hypothetical protein